MHFGSVVSDGFVSRWWRSSSNWPHPKEPLASGDLVPKVRPRGRKRGPGNKEARDSMHSEKRACNMKLLWEQQKCHSYEFFCLVFCKKSAFLFLHYILSSNPTGFVRKDFLRLKSSSRPNTRSCSKSSQASQFTVHCGCSCIITFALHPLIYWKLWSLIVRHVHHV